MIQGYSPAGLLHEVLHRTVIRSEHILHRSTAAANERKLSIDTFLSSRVSDPVQPWLSQKMTSVRNARNKMVSSCLARHGDDDFAPSMSGFQIADRLRGLTESVGAVYDGCHSAGPNEFAQKDTIFLFQRS